VFRIDEQPEKVCKLFVPQFNSAWNGTAPHGSVGTEFQRLGFPVAGVSRLDSTEGGDNAELRRIRREVLGDLGPILQSRSGWLRHKRLLEHCARGTTKCRNQTVQKHRRRKDCDRRFVMRLQRTINWLRRTDAAENLESDLARRRELLERMAQDCTSLEVSN